MEFTYTIFGYLNFKVESATGKFTKFIIKLLENI